MPLRRRGIYRLGDRRVNWWLVVEQGAAVVVDAGLPAHHRQLVQLLTELRMPADSIQAVVVTHGHADHLACIPQIRKGRQGVRVYIGADDQDLAARKPRLDPKVVRQSWRPAAIRTAIAYARADAGSIRPVSDTIALTDGEVLDVPGGLRFLHAPGHTPGSGMFLSVDGVLFSGDVLVTLDPFSDRTGPRTLPAFDNVDHEQALRSLDVVSQTDAAILLPGHGEPWHGGASDAARRSRSASGRRTRSLR